MMIVVPQIQKCLVVPQRLYAFSDGLIIVAICGE